MTSMGDLYHRATQATVQEEADQLLELCVQACESAGHPRRDAEQIARDHIGFFAANYCDERTRERAYRLYRTEDPVTRHRRQRGSTPVALGSDSEVS